MTLDSKNFEIPLYASHPVLETKKYHFIKSNNSYSTNAPNLSSFLTKTLSNEQCFSITCQLPRSSDASSKITVQLILDDKYILDDIHPYDIFSDIVLQTVVDDVTTDIDHLTPYFLKVYRDCFVSNKNSHDNLIKPFIEDDKTIVTLPLPFYFDRQDTNLRLADKDQKFILFVLSDKFVQLYNKIIDKLSITLLIETQLYKQRSLISNSYIESIEPLQLLDLSHLKYQCFTVKQTGVCKNYFIGVIDKFTNTIVTQKIIKKVGVCFEMITAMNLSVRNATLIQHCHSDIIPSENHILINFGGSGKFSDTFKGSCLNMNKLNNVTFWLEFNTELDSSRYQIVGFRTLINIV